jgi:nucleoside-diphosphate-sugar epimerase
VFGPNGKNLIKLATALTSGSRFVNYLRSSLFAHRQMNLLYVRNLVAALEFLIDYQKNLGGDTFIVSDDDERGNNFRDVERALMLGLGVRDYAFPPMPVPSVLLSAFLRLAGPAKAAPTRTYDSGLLRRSGWHKPFRLEQGLREFAAWYVATRRNPESKTL